MRTNSNNAQVNQSITESSVQHTWHRYAVKHCILAGLFKSLCLRTVWHSIYSHWCIICLSICIWNRRVSAYTARSQHYQWGLLAMTVPTGACHAIGICHSIFYLSVSRIPRTRAQQLLRWATVWPQ